ncbi:regulatory protein, luxR family [Actinacidiphila alni]|uniref:Regulatory protein, luxR family n=1 Tax=Actinacidiphila alni TaxID=380248 RepID=A0A1I2KIU4_9ACTN|nr:AAA family ATPase [Actinacidiphila alni]SFF66258.1 regulatory protein, luxR family [Actinacidiphila alni]
MLITSPTVIGRGAELAVLDEGLAAARDGDGRAVFLLGEAGIGKSRLAAECAFRAFTRGLAVLRGRSGATGGAATPFRPVAEALLSFVRLGGLPEDAELAPYRSALGGLLPEWRTAEHAGAPASPVETAEAMLRLLGTIGRDLTQHRHPGCLLVLEDLHDADTETLALIEYLCDNIQGQPIVLLATLRPESGPAEQLARQVAQRRAAVLSEPRPLTGEEVRVMAEAALAATGPPPHDDTAAARLPQEVVDRLARDADGNPFVVEELLSAMITADALRRGPAGDWHVSGDLDIDVPRTVVHSVSQRSARLSPDGRALLNSAAVLGRRFSLAVLQAVTGLPDRDLLVHLRAGMDAHLISPSHPMGDWYEFRHTLTAEALVAALVPAERAAIAARGADAIERAHPGLPGEWCVLVAALRETAGDGRAAALRFADAGRSALDDGAVDSAVSLLERALDLLPGADQAAQRSPLVEQLVFTLAENGQLDRACALADELPEAGPGALDAGRAAGLQARIAWAAVTAGRYEDAAARVRQVRQLLRLVPDGDGPSVRAALGPAVKMVEAHLVLSGTLEHDGDRTLEAERLAEQAAAGAERAGLPEIACQAWQLLAVLARRHGFEQADSYLEKCLVLANEHRLTAWQLDTLMWLGVNDFMCTGSSTRLERAHRAALGHGALALMYRAEAAMAMQQVLRGDYAGARELADRCAEGTARLRDADNHQFVLLTRVALAAHQGRRRQMERELAEFRRWGGEQSLQSPQAFGSRAICALLEEDHDQALRELDEAFAWEQGNPSVHYLNGRYGLRPLLRALTGQADAEEHAATVAEPAAALPWNRQFERLAFAVHEGRAGRGEQAAAAVAQAQEAGEPFLMARRLGQRLVAPAALEGGWGDPVGWLRDAEEYFHDAGVPAVANSCRDLLRRAGATVRQRRRGTPGVPADLRRQGLTAREYEVFLLLAPHLGNQEIAERLYISPRTVEKHVANLLAKTGRPHRSALCDYAAEQIARAD